MDDAQKQYAKVTQAIDDIDELMLKKARTEADNIRLEKAHQVIDAYGSDVPFKMQQAKKNLVHRHNPRIAAWYSSGEMGRGFAIVDQAVMEPADAHLQGDGDGLARLPAAREHR